MPQRNPLFDIITVAAFASVTKPSTSASLPMFWFEVNGSSPARPLQSKRRMRHTNVDLAGKQNPGNLTARESACSCVNLDGYSCIKMVDAMHFSLCCTTRTQWCAKLLSHNEACADALVGVGTFGLLYLKEQIA
jgi:hypothetical protein